MLILLFYLFQLFNVKSAIIGIDYGSEYIKVTLLSPGARFNILIDEQSKRKIPSIIYFDKLERTYGNTALSNSIINPINSATNIRLLFENDYKVKANSLYIYNNITSIYSKEELLAMSIKYIGKLVYQQVKIKKYMVALTVPTYFDYAMRKSILDSLKISKVKSAFLINENTAAAIQYSFGKKFETEKIETVVFYNLGATKVEVSVGKYSTLKVQNKTQSQLDMIDYEYDNNIGGKYFDTLLTNHFIQVFKKKLLDDKIDEEEVINILKSPKLIKKINAASEKARKILSVNKDTYVSIEGLYKDYDFTNTITRTTFQEIAIGLLERVLVPLTSIMNRQKADKIILLGGATRTPIIKQKIHDLFNNKLKETLNLDEAPSLGAAYYSSSKTPIFKGTMIKLIERLIFTVKFLIMDSKEILNSNLVEKGVLFNKFTEYGSRKAMSFKTNKNIFGYLIYTHDKDSVTIENSRKNIKRIPFDISGINDYYKKNEKHGLPKITVKFELNNNGMVNIYKSFADYGEKRETFNITKKRLKVNMNDDEDSILSSIQKLKELDKRDKNTKKSKEAYNSLESYIYESKYKLSLDKIIEVSNKKERDELKNELDTVENWLFALSELQSENKYKEKNKYLEGLFKDILFKYSELDKLPQTILQSSKLYKIVSNITKTVEKEKDWIPKEDIEKVNQMNKNMTIWIKDRMEEAKKVSKKDMPILTSKEVENKMKEVYEHANELKYRTKKSFDFSDIDLKNLIKNTTIRSNKTSNWLKRRRERKKKETNQTKTINSEEVSHIKNTTRENDVLSGDVKDKMDDKDNSESIEKDKEENKESKGEEEKEEL